MITTKQAVALAEKAWAEFAAPDFVAVAFKEQEKAFSKFAELVEKQVIKQLAAGSVVMPKSWKGLSGTRLCLAEESREAIAIMQAQNDQGRREIHSLRNVLQAACLGQEAFEQAWIKYLPDYGVPSMSEPKLEQMQAKLEGAYDSIREHQQLVKELQAKIQEQALCYLSLDGQAAELQARVEQLEKALLAAKDSAGSAEAVYKITSAAMKESGK